MRHVKKTLFIAYLVLAMLGRPGVAGAQAEGDDSSSPTDSSEGSGAAPVPQEREGERFAIGVSAGLSLSHFIGEDGTSDFADYTNKPDMTFGISGSIRLHEWLSIQSDILFVSKGRRTSLDGALVSTLDVNYIEIPVMARIEIPLSARVAPYLLAGPALGFLLRFQVDSEVDGVIMDRTDQAKRFDLSGILGAGVKVALTRQHGLTLEGRYDRSFTRFLKSEEDVENRVFAFMLGYQYSLSSTP
jgi:opacity protein-like surface antigen